jgi:hypothetical protein
MKYKPEEIMKWFFYIFVYVAIFFGLKYHFYDSRKASLTWGGSEMPIRVNGIAVTLPDGGIGEKTLGGDFGYRWISANKELEVNINYFEENRLLVNGDFYGFPDPNDQVEIQYGPKVIINGATVNPISEGDKKGTRLPK